MSQESGKLVKVTFEYENKISTLSGEQVEDWIKDVNSMCAFMQNRGMNPFEKSTYTWIDAEKEKELN